MIKVIVDKENSEKNKVKKEKEFEKRKDERWLTSGEDKIISEKYVKKDDEDTKKPGGLAGNLLQGFLAGEEAAKKKRKDFDFSGW